MLEKKLPSLSIYLWRLQKEAAFFEYFPPNELSFQTNLEMEFLLVEGTDVGWILKF